MSHSFKLHRAVQLFALAGLCSFAASPSAFAQGELIITEIHYHPDAVTDPNENQEFVEIKNVGDEAVATAGYMIGGVGVVTFTQASIAPGGFLVLARSSAAFAARYGFAPGGTYAGNLRNSGEEVDIVPPGATAAVFIVDYWDGGNEDPLDPADDDRPLWPSNPDGVGYSLVPQNPNVNTDPNDFRNWRPSINLGGSPGADEPLPSPLFPVFINEIRTRDGAFSNDAIEFFNPNTVAVDISNWFLSDNIDDPKKSPVPSGTIVPAGGYVVLENGVNGFAISLSSRGERVFLYSANGVGVLTGFVNGLHFGASGDGRTFSRFVNSDGVEQFPASTPSLNAANSGPSVGPVVITEIMYNPGILGGVDEFVEIKNISDAVVPLYDPLRPTNNWRIEGVSYVIVGAQPTLAPGEVALVTPTPAATFRAAHGVPAGVQIFGAYTGSLNNGGEEIALQRPENLDEANVNAISYINVDVVLYDNSSPWPLAADGLGRSLVRIDEGGYGNDPANWQPSLLLEGSPGFIYNYTGPEILVNEVLAHTDLPQVDVIELYNPTGAAVSIGGWYLTDDKDFPQKFQIPTGTMIPAGGFWVVNQDNDANEASAPANYFGNAFQISSRGDSIYLFSADGGGVLTGYRHGFGFRATENGSAADGNLTLGRYVDSFGEEHFTTMVRSFEVNRFVANPAGAVNNPPSVGPLVISEIGYDPAVGSVEFVELRNITASAVPLYDTTPVGGNINNTWGLEGVDFRFPTPTPSAPAGAVIVILPLGTDVAAFRAANSVPAAAIVYGGAQGFIGALNNAGEEIALVRPDAPDVVAGETLVPMIAVDVVNYNDVSPWPVTGGGVTLEKFNLAGFSDDPIHWRAGVVGGTPGSTPEGLTYSTWALGVFTAAELMDAGLSGCEGDVNGDGVPNLFAYAFGYDPHEYPGPDLLPVESIVNVSGGDVIALTYRQLTAAVDLTYDVEVSGDLDAWTPMGGVPFGVVIDNGDGTETVTMRAAAVSATSERQFMRLRVTK